MNARIDDPGDHHNGGQDVQPGVVLLPNQRRDRRWGFYNGRRLIDCIDIGHATRAGVTADKAVKDFKDRLFDLHIKDVTMAAEEGKAVEMGRGVIDFPAFVKALRKINYKGVCSIEYEKDLGDPLPGIAESIGFFKGVVAVKG